MKSFFATLSPAAEMARGESREHLIEMGYDVPADLKDISEMKPETLATELGRLTRILDDEYWKVNQDKTSQAETTTQPKTVTPTRHRKRRPKGPKEQAWSDMGESVKRKPPPYW